MFKRAGKKWTKKTVTKIKAGKPRPLAVAETISEQTAKRIRLKQKRPFTTEDLKRLRSKVFPRTYGTRFEGIIRDRLFRLKQSAKKRLIAETFGLKGERLGLLTIQPEMQGYVPEIRKFLSTLGCKIIYSKNLILTKGQLYDIFGKKQMHLYWDFPIESSVMLCNPIKVLVFRHLSPEQYLQKSRYLEHLRNANPKKHKRIIDRLSKATGQAIFDKIFKGEHEEVQPGTIRGDIVQAKLKEMGFNTPTLVQKGKLLDMFGFLEAHPDIPALSVFGGVHAPKAEELFKEATILFTRTELQEIKKRTSKKA